MLQIELTEGDCVNGSTGCKMGAASLALCSAAGEPGLSHAPSQQQNSLQGFGEVMGNCTRLFTQLVLLLSLNTLTERQNIDATRNALLNPGIRPPALLPPFPGILLVPGTTNAPVQRQRWHLRAGTHHCPTAPRHESRLVVKADLLPSGKQLQASSPPRVLPTCD